MCGFAKSRRAHRFLALIWVSRTDAWAKIAIAFAIVFWSRAGVVIVAWSGHSISTTAGPPGGSSNTTEIWALQVTSARRGEH